MYSLHIYMTFLYHMEKCLKVSQMSLTTAVSSLKSTTTVTIIKGHIPKRYSSVTFSFFLWENSIVAYSPSNHPTGSTQSSTNDIVWDTRQERPDIEFVSLSCPRGRVGGVSNNYNSIYSCICFSHTTQKRGGAWREILSCYRSGSLGGVPRNLCCVFQYDETASKVTPVNLSLKRLL